MIKQKQIFFCRMKSSPKLSISYGDYSLRQQNTAENIGCHLDSNLNGESMACRVLKKINIVEAKQLFELFVQKIVV